MSDLGARSLDAAFKVGIIEGSGKGLSGYKINFVPEPADLEKLEQKFIKRQPRRRRK